MSVDRRSTGAVTCRSCGGGRLCGQSGNESESRTGQLQTGRQAREASGGARVTLVVDPSSRGFTRLSCQLTDQRGRLGKAHWPLIMARTARGEVPK